MTHPFRSASCLLGLYRDAAGYAGWKIAQSIYCNVDVLDFGVQVQRFGAQFAADAAHFEAAERRLDVDRAV